MFCINCGKEVPEGENNCPSCGVSLNNLNYGTSPISDGNQPSEVKDINNNKVVDEEKNKKKADILTLVATLLLLISFFSNNYYLFVPGSILSLTLLIYIRIKYPSNKASSVSLKLLGIAFILFFVIMFLMIWMCAECVSVNNCYNCPG